MGKVYNLSMLFEENEFDVQKSFGRHESKEAYFEVLNRFTLDCGTILKRLDTEKFKSGEIDQDQFIRYIDRLQGMLSNIGAVKLAWDFQSLHHLLEKKRFGEYAEKIEKVLSEVEMLRKRIIFAERVEGELPPRPVPKAPEAKQNVTEKTKQGARLRSADFEKLVMLIDNFELRSADESAEALMRYSYSSEIDKALASVKKALDDFNYPECAEEAKTLMRLVADAERVGKWHKKTILAIDDMPDVLRTVKAMLKDKYNVFGATNYEAAMRFLRSNTADLVLLDIEMPGMDGFAIIQLLRKLPEFAAIPIVFLTSNVSNDNVKMALSLGARDFIKKPVDLAVLVNKLDNAFAK